MNKKIFRNKKLSQLIKILRVLLVGKSQRRLSKFRLPPLPPLQRISKKPNHKAKLPQPSPRQGNNNSNSRAKDRISNKNHNLPLQGEQHKPIRGNQLVELMPTPMDMLMVDIKQKEEHQEQVNNYE